MYMVLEAGGLLRERTAVLLLGGEPPRRPELRELICRAEYLAAADGGAAAALAVGRVPDLLVGDFDSLEPELRRRCAQAPGCELLELPVRKDVTDGEFLYSRLAAAGWRRLVILGALGGRFDQTLANVLCTLPLAEAGLEVCLAGERELLVPLAAVAKEETRLVLEGFGGRVVSLLALGGGADWVRLVGFDYPLDGELAANVTLGLSNAALGERSEIWLWGGSLLVCAAWG